MSFSRKLSMLSMTSLRRLCTCFLLLVITALVGCSVKRDFYATGGSRADGVVDMAYDYRSLENPVIDPKQAYSIARSKCALWGYADTEPFGGKIQACTLRSGFGECAAWQVTIKYQCLGSLERPGAPLNYLAPAVASTPRAAPLAEPVSANTSPEARQPLSEKDYQDIQLDKLMHEDISYEEYQRRYRAIMGR
jgi:hypothetical protein